MIAYTLPFQGLGVLCFLRAVPIELFSTLSDNSFKCHRFHDGGYFGSIIETQSLMECWRL
jgi:hypothetical protein